MCELCLTQEGELGGISRLQNITPYITTILVMYKNGNVIISTERRKDIEQVLAVGIAKDNSQNCPLELKLVLWNWMHQCLWKILNL